MAKIIYVNGKEETIKDVSLENLQKIVGGYIQAITCRDTGQVIIANEEGKLDNLPVNRRATALFLKNLRSGDFLVGNIVVCKKGEFT